MTFIINFIKVLKKFFKSYPKGKYSYNHREPRYIFLYDIYNKFHKGFLKGSQKGILKGNIYTIIENLDIFSFMTFIINFIKDS